MFPLAIREDPFLNSQHGKTAVEWEILFPHGVICLSRSTLNGLPSSASKSFLCVSALPTLPWFFPSLNAKQLFYTIYYAACLITVCLIAPASCISEIPIIPCSGCIPVSHVETAEPSKQRVLARSSSGLYNKPHLQPQRLLSALGFAARSWPRDAGFSPQDWMFTSTTAL